MNNTHFCVHLPDLHVLDVENKNVELIYTDAHSIWQTHNQLYHTSTLKQWEQDKCKRLSAAISFLHSNTLNPRALERDDLFFPDLQT